jgi:hypothetical protein
MNLSSTPKRKILFAGVPNCQMLLVVKLCLVVVLQEALVKDECLFEKSLGFQVLTSFQV